MKAATDGTCPGAVTSIVEGNLQMAFSNPINIADFNTLIKSGKCTITTGVQATTPFEVNISFTADAKTYSGVLDEFEPAALIHSKGR